MSVSTVIGVCGRSASGKTSFAKKLQQQLSIGGRQVGLLSMDDFYRELTEEEHHRALANEFDFDCLEAFDIAALTQTLETARAGESVVSYYRYDHANHKHHSVPMQLDPCDVWIIEGLYLFAVKSIVDLFDLRVFMEIDADTSLVRRIRRDIVSRRRDVEGVLAQYERYVKPAYDLLVQPSRNKADVCVMHGAENERGFRLVLDYCQKGCQKK